MPCGAFFIPGDIFMTEQMFYRTLAHDNILPKGCTAPVGKIVRRCFVIKRYVPLKKNKTSIDKQTVPLKGVNIWSLPAKVF
jgi:hypothetical protein